MGKVRTAKVSGEVGKDIDESGDKLHPGYKVIYWTGEGRGDLKSWPAELSHRLLDGTWAILYFQRASPSYSVTTRYSPKAKIHSWTFKEAYFDNQ